MQSPDSIYALEPKTIGVGGLRNVGLDYTRQLGSGELLSAVLSAAILETGSGIVLGTAAVNVAPFNDDSVPPVAVAIGCGVQLTVDASAGVNPNGPAGRTTYTLRVIAQTNQGEKLPLLCPVVLQG